MRTYAWQADKWPSFEYDLSDLASLIATATEKRLRLKSLLEIIGWTDCSAALSMGTVLKGTAWGRPNDAIGIGGVIEALSPQARAYFAAGGLGILIGDGQLNYRPEQIFEAYYAYSIIKGVTFTADYQFVNNPAYNADRGPVSIFSGRLHGEF